MIAAQEKLALLSEITLFKGLSERQRTLIVNRAKIQEVGKGQFIYTEGSPACNFYCIIQGRVVISAHTENGSETVLEYLHRGQYFGIISLMTGETHSVTARALNDCLLLIIPNNDFHALLHKIPRLAIDVGKTLSRRLKRKDLHPKTIFESTVISVVSVYANAGVSQYAFNLAVRLSRETHKSVLLLNIVPREKLVACRAQEPATVFHGWQDTVVPSEVKSRYITKNEAGIDQFIVAYASAQHETFETVNEIISCLVNDYHFIVVDISSEAHRSALITVRQSDVVHVLSDLRPAILKQSRAFIERLKEEFFAHQEKIRLLTFERKDKLPQPIFSPVFATLPYIPEPEYGSIITDKRYAAALTRIARHEGDCQIGLALGVGMAYGFCHVGVLKVLEEKNVHVDIIAGASMGAVIASLWALGHSSDDIIAITKEFKKRNFIWGLVDFTFPLMGFMKGRKLHSFLKRHVGSATFDDLKIPLKIIAADIRKKESIIIERGPLADAIMASCSMPGVFMPFRLKETALFDGGIVNPLPTEPLFELGIKKIIAVNVTPSREDVLRQYEKMKAPDRQKLVEQSGRRNPVQRLNPMPYIQKKLGTNILDIIFSSIEVLQSEVAKQEEQLADIVLHPDTSGLHWLELHRAEEFARRGEDEARRHLERILRLVNE